ncbi:hypothetical protein OUZ56_009811 [Daphnia magna]|uniref:Uncharacterized protein n=1 Tax=Daphnia magna TaxID=35525 RepID=A0ABR0AGX8_9CRUS|nr:hypothetical protein OUZ56_009811 [Daphnia magna]
MLEKIVAPPGSSMYQLHEAAGPQTKTKGCQSVQLFPDVTFLQPALGSRLISSRHSYKEAGELKG